MRQSIRRVNRQSSIRQAIRQTARRAVRSAFEGLEERRHLAANDPLTIAVVGTGAAAVLQVTGTATADTIVVTRTSATGYRITNGDWVAERTGTYSGVRVNAGEGDDSVRYITSITHRATLSGGAGNDTLTGTDFVDSLDGGDGADSLVGSGGNDTLVGLGGNDTLEGGAGVDSLLGGTGDDSLNGGGDNDVLNGDVGDDTLAGGAGNDNLTGLGGADLLNGGDGNDTLAGGTENDTMNGDGGDDSLDGGTGADEMNGGDGADTVSYATRTAAQPVNVSLDGQANDGQSGELDNVSGTDVEIVLGGLGADTLAGNGSANTLNGGAGADSISGNGGADSLLGMAGNDTINGGEGADRIYGGTENDSLFGDAGDDLIEGGAGNDSLSGGAGSDTLLALGGGALDSVTGGDGIDNFWLDSNTTEVISDYSDAEQALNALKRVATFAASVAKDILGQKLADPTAAAGTKVGNFATRPLFSSNGPSRDDINQGQAGSCWWLSTLSAVAGTEEGAARIKQNVTDFGDGTYGVRFFSMTGTEQFVRVDADLQTYSWSTTTPYYASFGAEGSIWVSIYEKALTRVRGSKLGNYTTIDGGWMDEAFRRIGMDPTNTNKGQLASDNDLVTLLTDAQNANKSMTVGFLSVPGGMNLVGYHAYTIDRVNDDGTITLRNPWGVDNQTSTDGLNDGYVTLTAAQLRSAMTTISVA
jgi:Ca2+-binding RTX toxin-like protein